MTKLVVSLSLCAFLAHAESADDILKRWDATSKESTAFSANLQQKHYTKVVRKTDTYKAVLRLRRTDKGVFGIVRFAEPDPHTIHFAGDRIEIYNPNANQLDSYDAKKFSNVIRDVLMLGFGTSGKEIRNSYTVKDGGLDTIAGHKTTRIELTPKDKKLKDYAEKIELWIPEGENNPIQAKSSQPSGDYDIFEYSNVNLLKPPLKDSDFDFESDQMPNKSTHVVKN